MKKFLISVIGFLLNLLSYLSSRLASKIAIKLFASPLKGKLTEVQTKLLESAYTEKLEYNNLPIAVYKWPGTNQRILLLHGWESNTARWQYLIDSLNKNHTVIAIDAPAHGNSGSTEFNAILYAEFINTVTKKYKPNIIIGHSVGGMAAIFSEYKYPTKSSKKIILLGAPAHFNGVFDRYVKLMHYNQRIAEGMNRLIIERYNRPKNYFSAAHFAKDITHNILIIHDKHDKVIPYNDAILLHNSFPQSRLYTTHGLGHSLIQNEVTLVLLEFINS